MNDYSGNTMFAEEFVEGKQASKIKDLRTFARLVTGIARREYEHQQKLRDRESLKGPHPGQAAQEIIDTASEDSTLAFGRQVCDHVQREIIERRRCRTSLFTTILIVMTTAGFALIGFIQGFGGIEKARQWIMFGSAIPLGILTTTILIMIQKARAINYRIGFLTSSHDNLDRRNTKVNSSW